MIGSFYGITALSYLHAVDDKNFSVFEELKKSINAENEEIIFNIDCEYRKIKSLLNKIEIGNVLLPVVSIDKTKDNIFQVITHEKDNEEKEEVKENTNDDVIDVDIIEDASTNNNKEFVELSSIGVVSYIDMLKRKVDYIDKFLAVECKGEVLDKTLIYGNRSTNIRLIIKRDLISIRNILGRRLNIPSGRISLTKLEIINMAIEKIQSFLETYVLDNKKSEEAFELMKNKFLEIENSGVLEYVPDLVGKLKLAGLCPTKMFESNYKLIDSKLSQGGSYSSEAVITKGEKLKVLIIKDILEDLYDLNTGIGEYVEDKPGHYNLSDYHVEEDIMPKGRNTVTNIGIQGEVQEVVNDTQSDVIIDTDYSHEVIDTDYRNEITVGRTITEEPVVIQSSGVIVNGDNQEETFVVVDNPSIKETHENEDNKEYSTDYSLNDFTDADIDKFIDDFLS